MCDQVGLGGSEVMLEDVGHFQLLLSCRGEQIVLATPLLLIIFLTLRHPFVKSPEWSRAMRPGKGEAQIVAGSARRCHSSPHRVDRLQWFKRSLCMPLPPPSTIPTHPNTPRTSAL